MENYKVIKKEFQEFDKLVFVGSKKDCKFIYNFLIEYHKYDMGIDVSITESDPEYETLDDFKKDFKYELEVYEDELRNKK